MKNSGLNFKDKGKGLVALLLIPSLISCAATKKPQIALQLMKPLKYEETIKESINTNNYENQITAHYNVNEYQNNNPKDIEKKIIERIKLPNDKDLNNKSRINTERILLGCVIAGQAGDYITTKNKLDKGGREINPLIGSHPSNETLLLIKAGTIGIVYGLGQLFPSHRKKIYALGCGLGLFSIGFNLSPLSE